MRITIDFWLRFPPGKEFQAASDLQERLNVGRWVLARKETSLGVSPAWTSPKPKNKLSGLRSAPAASTGHPDRCVCRRCEALR